MSLARAPGPLPAVQVAQAEPSIDQQVEEAHDDLADASKAVKRARDELARVAADLPKAERDLAGADAAASAAVQARDHAVALLKAAEANVAASQVQVAAAQAQVTALRLRVGALARQAYISGDGYQELEVLLSSHDPADFAVAMSALLRRSRGNSSELERMAAAREMLAAELSRVEGFRAEAERHRDAAARQVAAAESAARDAAYAKATVDGLVARKRSALRTAASHKRSVRRMYDQLQAEQRRIARAAAEAARREAERNGRRPGAADPPSGHDPAPDPGPGGLTWPIPGARAGGRTGWRVHPVYGYRSCHTGDDISAGSGTPIRSAGAGTVASVESGGPYGNHTLVAHANGLSTMYAHQSRIAVRSGQRVSAGQVIGYVGSTGWSTGPHLHFEVHVRGVPYEPMGWFGEGTRRPVSCWSG